jgi:hypothetical protein
VVPEFDHEDEAFEFLSPRVEEIFEEHLDGWYRVPADWPTMRDVPTFGSWFEFSFHSVVVDFGEEPIEHEEMWMGTACALMTQKLPPQSSLWLFDYSGHTGLNLTKRLLSISLTALI